MTLADDHGETKDIRITINGRDGKISFLAEMEDMPDNKIRLVVDKFEAKQ